MSTRVAIITATVAGALVARPTAARAEVSPQVPAVVQARALSDSGRALHEVGEYDLAIEAFRRAYQLDPRPALIFNLAQAYRLDGDCDTSSQLYRSYLEQDLDGWNHDLAEQNLALADACVEHPGRGLRRAGVATAIGGGALVGLGAFVLGNEPAAAPPDTHGTPAHDREWAGTALVVAGGAAVVTGATLYLLGRRAERRGPSISISVSPGVRDAGVRMSWDF